jgi:hypothetical protein
MGAMSVHVSEDSLEVDTLVNAMMAIFGCLEELLTGRDEWRFARETHT